MDHLAELERLQHQLELANRAIALIGDRETVERLETFASEIKERLADLRAALGRGKTSRRAYTLWQEAGRPEGRDVEFWLRAESEWPGESRTPRDAATPVWNRSRADDLNPRAGFPADCRLARPLPLSPNAPQGEAVLGREVRMPEVYEDDIRARAYKLWEDAGRPEGRIDEFWHEAERQLKDEQVRHELKTPDTL
jgi:hypothetical protein